MLRPSALSSVLLAAGLLFGHAWAGSAPGTIPEAGTIQGEVTAEDGDSIAGATVTVRSPRLSAPLQRTTDADGNFTFSDLPPGDDYEVTVTVEGYVGVLRRRVKVRVGRVANYPFELHERTEATVMTSDFLSCIPNGRLPPSAGPRCLPGTIPVAGTIQGEVTEQDGDSIAGATVTLKSPMLLSGQRLATTGEDGKFTFSDLPPGDDYEVVVTTEGYRGESIGLLTVQVGRVSVLGFELSEDIPIQELRIRTDLGWTAMTFDRSGACELVPGCVRPAKDDKIRDPWKDVQPTDFAFTRAGLLRAGTLPPPARVKVEDFLNYPDWTYPTPDEQGTDSPVSATLEATTNPWAPGHLLLRIGLQAREADTQRALANLVFLVDVPTYDTGLLSRARLALHTLVDVLEPEDTIALVTYGGCRKVVLPPMGGQDHPVLHAAVDQLTLTGCEIGADALKLAYELASPPGAVKPRLVVLSAGATHIGEAPAERALIAAHAGRGITLSTVNLGGDLPQFSWLSGLASRGGGKHYVARSGHEAERLFVDHLAGALPPVAQRLRAGVAFHSSAKATSLGAESLSTRGGEVTSGQRVTLLYDVVLSHPLAPDETLATWLEYAKAPADGAPEREWRTPILASSVTDFASASADFRAAAGFARFAELLRGADAPTTHDLDQVAEILAGARREGRDDGDVEAMVLNARWLAYIPAGSGW